MCIDCANYGVFSDDVSLILAILPCRVVVVVFTLMVGFAMAEIVSALPSSGGKHRHLGYMQSLLSHRCIAH